MGYNIERGTVNNGGTRAGGKTTLVIASLCLCLFLFGPHYLSQDTLTVGPEPLRAQTTSTSDSAGDDTPSAEDIADFASEFDKDGDGEVDEPEADEEAEEAEEPEEAEEAEEADEADQEDEGDDSGDSDDVDRENQYDDDDDGEETQDEEGDDMAHSGKNRDDIDGEASPEFRLSGYDRYRIEGSLRRLGTRAELTPLIAREENILLEN